MVYVAVCDFNLMPCLAVLVELFLLNGWRNLHIFVRAIFSTRHAQHVIAGTFLLLLLSSSYWSCPVVVTRL